MYRECKKKIEIEMRVSEHKVIWMPKKGKVVIQEKV